MKQRLIIYKLLSAVWLSLLIVAMVFLTHGSLKWALAAFGGAILIVAAKVLLKMVFPVMENRMTCPACGAMVADATPQCGCGYVLYSPPSTLMSWMGFRGADRAADHAFLVVVFGAAAWALFHFDRWPLVAWLCAMGVAVRVAALGYSILTKRPL